MLTLYDAARCPYCARVRIVLAEKDVEYEPIEIDLADRPAWIYEKNSTGRVPVIEEDGKTYAETGLIMEYLVDRHAHDLAPPRDSAAYWRWKYWLHYAEGSLMPPLLLKLVVDRLGLLAYPARPFVKSQLKLHLDFLESELRNAPWFLGERFSAADIMLSFPLEVSSNRAGLDATRPKLMDFLHRIHARPAYKRALEKGGPYEIGR